MTCLLLRIIVFLIFLIFFYYLKRDLCNVKLRTDRAAEKKLLVSPVTTLLDP